MSNTDRCPDTLRSPISDTQVTTIKRPMAFSKAEVVKLQRFEIMGMSVLAYSQKDAERIAMGR